MKDYLYIRAWEHMMGSGSFYRASVLKMARAENAPETAIYRDNVENRWRTYDEIKSESTKREIQKIADQIKERHERTER